MCFDKSFRFDVYDGFHVIMITNAITVITFLFTHFLFYLYLYYFHFYLYLFLKSLPSNLTNRNSADGSRDVMAKKKKINK